VNIPVEWNLRIGTLEWRSLDGERELAGYSVVTMFDTTPLEMYTIASSGMS
jgi:hypothetical protein